jgi:hypothetical protein
MQEINHAQIEAEHLARQQQTEAAARQIAGQALLAQEGIRTMRPIVETGLGSDMLMQIGRQINNGAMIPLGQALAQAVDIFRKGLNCTEEQARLCVAYMLLNPEKTKAAPPRLATKQEQRQANKKPAKKRRP